METRRNQKSTEVREDDTVFEDIPDAHLGKVKLYDPSLGFKYLNNQWQSALTGITSENTRRANLILMRSGFLEAPAEQFLRNNYRCKSKIYALTERGKTKLQDRDIFMLPYTHRSNSFSHELTTDLCFRAPLHLLAKDDPKFKLLIGEPFLDHRNTPAKLKSNKHPFSIFLYEDNSNRKYRLFDSIPFKIGYEDRQILCPGIETHHKEKNQRPSDKRSTLGNHFLEILYCLKNNLFLKRYGWPSNESIIVPIIFTDQDDMNKFTTWVLKDYGEIPNFIFKKVSNLSASDFHPRPSTKTITEPWLRLGKLRPYSLHKLQEI